MINPERQQLLKNVQTYYKTKNKSNKLKKFINHFKNKEQ